MTRSTEPDRELRAEATIAAAPEQVWELLTDFSRMPDWSPELVRMVPLKRGGLRVGQWYLGLNRRKAALWPTRSVVAVVEPGRRLVWDTTSSGARWIWALEPRDGGTHVVHTRPVPKRITTMSKIFAPLALGGSAEHADELEVGMAQTLARLQASVESAPTQR